MKGISDTEISPTSDEAGSGTSNSSADSQLAAQLLEESKAMAKYALSNGLEVDADTIGSLQQQIVLIDKGTLQTSSIIQLATIHQSLAKSVYPATPRAITMLENERSNKDLFYFLGPVPLIRQLSAAAAFALAALLLVSLSVQVNVDNINLGLLHSNNQTLFLNQLFLVCSAGLGACFSGLFLANSFIAKATYDPRFDSSYWSRIILGIIAGIILVELLPSTLFDDGSMKNFGKPSLAMFGGFSANVVYRILQRLVDSLEMLVKGKAEDSLDNQRALMQIKASEQRTQLNADLANKVVGLMKEMEGKGQEEIKQSLNSFVNGLLTDSSKK